MVVVQTGAATCAERRGRWQIACGEAGVRMGGGVVTSICSPPRGHLLVFMCGACVRKRVSEREREREREREKERLD